MIPRGFEDWLRISSVLALLVSGLAGNLAMVVALLGIYAIVSEIGDRL